jgi:FkbM family methyltransferase
MTSKAIRAIKAATVLVNPKTWGPFTETYEQTGFDHAFDVTWSQGGEDIGLLGALAGIRNGRYVDVGAHHPSRFSVTRKLWSLGWSGVNIDANPNLLDAFQRERPNDINLWACVGRESSYTLAIFEEPALSTVSADWRLKFLSENQKISSEIVVPGVSLKKIFDDYFDSGFPDLLCIDAEGADLDVLQSAELASGNGPQWLLLEADPPLVNVLQTPAVAHAISVGYEIHLIMGMSTLLRKTS